MNNNNNEVQDFFHEKIMNIVEKKENRKTENKQKYNYKQRKNE